VCESSSVVYSSQLYDAADADGRWWWWWFGLVFGLVMMMMMIRLAKPSQQQ
jgi:hypothetical protein